MFSSNHISNFNKPRSSINNNFLDNKSSESISQPVQKVHLKSVPQPNSNSLPENNQHKLQYRYNLWYSKRATGKITTTQSYDQNLKLLANFGSIEEFWQIYSYLVRPRDLIGFYEFHLFKEGIKPMWEDEANKNGGKWVLRLKKGLSSRCWENLVLAILGEQFFLGEEICGAVISTRNQEDFISIWNRNSNNRRIVLHIREVVKKVLNLPANTVLQYKPHNVRFLDGIDSKPNNQQQSQQNQNQQNQTQSQNNQFYN